MPNFEAGALAATLRACIREGETYEAITRAATVSADMLERQADRIAQLEAEAETLHAAAEGWRKRAEEAEATLDARSAGYAEAVEATRSEIRRQALEEAVATLEALPRVLGLGPIGGEVIDRSQAIAAILALADKPAAGGAHVGDTL